MNGEGESRKNLKHAHRNQSKNTDAQQDYYQGFLFAPIRF